MPFDTDDAMFNPPLGGVGPRMSAYEYDSNIISAPIAPVVTYHYASPIVPDTPPMAKPPSRKRKPPADNIKKPHKGIIPPDEDMRRLFQECKIGVGNANLLSEALATATPEELRNPVIAVRPKQKLKRRID